MQEKNPTALRRRCTYHLKVLDHFYAASTLRLIELTFCP